VLRASFLWGLMLAHGVGALGLLTVPYRWAFRRPREPDPCPRVCPRRRGRAHAETASALKAGKAGWAAPVARGRQERLGRLDPGGAGASAAHQGPWLERLAHLEVALAPLWVPLQSCSWVPPFRGRRTARRCRIDTLDSDNAQDLETVHCHTRSLERHNATPSRQRCPGDSDRNLGKRGHGRISNGRPQWTVVSPSLHDI